MDDIELIPKDNEEFICPVCKGSHLLYGEYFTEKHLIEHHNWSPRAAQAYILYRDTPQMLATIAKRRAESIGEPSGKLLSKSDRPSNKEVEDFLKRKVQKQFEEKATALLQKAGIFQGSLEDTLKSLGIQNTSFGDKDGQR